MENIQDRSLLYEMWDAGIWPAAKPLISLYLLDLYGAYLS